ncbi:Protein of unknown function (DUF1278) [Abeliophyllum distichum]|uniref:Prolamin-like domain-containing protein n=1 Tax=Abeliophyllum distichum TaxID=126358 RepID=A0ABD1SUF1_9LAMI
MPNTRSIEAIVLIFACMSAMAAPNFAQLLGESHQTGLLGLTRLGVPHVFQCIRSVSKVPSCVNEVLLYIISHQLELLGPECCKVLLQVDENCWPKVEIPVNPLSPSLVKNYCDSIQN